MASAPGAMPQAGMECAVGVKEQNAGAVLRGKAPRHTSLGHRPRDAKSQRPVPSHLGRDEVTLNFINTPIVGRKFVLLLAEERAQN